jgi:hypothetical protein
MSYIVIDDFKLGMDRRKERIAGTAGALWEGINGHINRGGSFERRKKFVKKYALPAGTTFGLTQVNKQLYVFGSSSAPGTVPPGVNYQQLAHTSTANMTGILDVTSFGGKIYAIAQFDNGDIFHYYDGARITTWDTVAHGVSSNSAIASALAASISLDPRYIATSNGTVVTIIAAIAGAPFAISATAVDGGSVNDQTLTLSTVQANVVASAETPAEFTITVTGGTPQNNGDPNQNSIQTLHDTNSLGLIGAPVPWVVSDDFTAQAVANAINQQAAALSLSSIAGYTATAAAGTVTVYAPAGAGTANNGLHILSRTTGNFSWDSPSVTGITNTGISEVDAGAQSGGVGEIAAVAQVVTATVGGTYEDGDIFTITLDTAVYRTTGLAAGTGTTCLTYNQRVYSAAYSLLEYCALNDPTTWGSGTAGFINMTNQDANNDPLVGIQQYQNRIAIFSRSNVQIWILAVDPSQNTFQQSVQNTGALSNRSTTQYGNIDVFYLDTTGERSIRARDSSNAPAVNDVGVAVDSFIQDFMATLSGKQISRACSVIEPLDGRYWLALYNRIFVYSFFPGSKISAWTYYDLGDEIGAGDISEMVRSGNRVYLRSGDSIYLYGGDTNAVYPNDNEILAKLSLPFLSASKPATTKGVNGFDVGLTGEWTATLLVRPDDDTQGRIAIGVFNKPSYDLNKNPIQMPTPLFAVEMVTSKGGPATISNMVIHFDYDE